MSEPIHHLTALGLRDLASSYALGTHDVLIIAGRGEGSREFEDRWADTEIHWCGWGYLVQLCNQVDARKHLHLSLNIEHERWKLTPEEFHQVFAKAVWVRVCVDDRSRVEPMRLALEASGLSVAACPNWPDVLTGIRASMAHRVPRWPKVEQHLRDGPGFW